MVPRLRISVLCVSASLALALACLARTTSLTMTLFFMAGLPLYALGAVFYAAHVLRDLRRHRVL